MHGHRAGKGRKLRSEQEIRQLEVLLELPECSRLYLCAKIFNSIQGSALSASWTSELNKAKGTAH